MYMVTFPDKLIMNLIILVELVALLNFRKCNEIDKSPGGANIPDFHDALVPESDILLEDIFKSSEVSNGLFDSHVPGKIGDRRKRRRRQVNQDDIREALCKDKNPGEFFRLVAGDVHCRDVVACADHGLQAIRCPPGLAFDLRKQTCDWRREVKDCNQKSRPKLSLPLYHTTEPVCPNHGEIACGDGTCLPRFVTFICTFYSQCIFRTLFCDDNIDCADGSDENLCDPRNDPNRASECDPDLCR